MSAALRPFSGGPWLDAPAEIDWSEVKLTADGDSLTAGGVDGETPWPTLIASEMTGASISNLASIGDRVGEDMLPDGTVQVDPTLDGGRTWNIAVGWGGINDLANGRTPAQIHGDIETWCTDRRTSGWDLVIWVNVTWTTVLGSQTNIDSLNSLLAGDHGFCDALIDAHTACGTDSSNPSFWQTDDLHLTTAGQQAVADLIHDAIVALVS